MNIINTKTIDVVLSLIGTHGDTIRGTYTCPSDRTAKLKSVMLLETANAVGADSYIKLILNGNSVRLMQFMGSTAAQSITIAFDIMLYPNDKIEYHTYNTTQNAITYLCGVVIEERL